MWLDELDVARKLETLERHLSDEEPELVRSFRALSHPSLRSELATTSTSPARLMLSVDQRNDIISLVAFCAMLLVAIGLITGSFAALLSAISLTVATLAVVGVLALLSDVFPHRGRQVKSRRH